MKKKKFKTSKEYKIERLQFLRKGLTKNWNNLPSYELKPEKLILLKKNTHSWFNVRQSNEFHRKYKVNFETNLLPSTVIKCNKINIIFSKDQKDIIFNWYEGCRIMYNETISYFRKCRLENEPCSSSFMRIRTYILCDAKQRIAERFQVPSHTLDGAIKQACTSYKTCLTHLRLGLIRHFRLRYMKQSKSSQSILLEKTAFKEGTFFPRFLGTYVQNSSNFDYQDVAKDCMLHFNKVTLKITLLVPVEKECKQQPNHNKFLSIDPGIKPFLTCLSNTSLIEIGNNVDSVLRKEFKLLEKAEKSSTISKKSLKKVAFRIHKKNV